MFIFELDEMCEAFLFSFHNLVSACFVFFKLERDCELPNIEHQY